MSYGDECVEKWLYGELKLNDVEKYLRNDAGMNSDDGDFEYDEVWHVARICHSIYYDMENIRAGGHFVKAVINNDLMEASLRADGTIRKAFREIMWFLNNAAPYNVTKAIRSDRDTKDYYEELKE